MLDLMLLRHAKSSWSDFEQADIDRPLNGRGRRAALTMGRHMASNDIMPQLVLCSPAKRAKETWDLVAGELGASPSVLIEPDIYDFGNGETLLECLRHKAGAANSVLLVGHNPSIEGLAQKLAGKGGSKIQELLEKKYPTGALAVIRFDFDNWKDIADGAGTLLRFDRPKDISGQYPA
jgi:phosphohistidine phosphatase